MRVTKQYGIRVSHAASGEKAFRAIEKTIPDVILLDLRLPDMNGLEFARFVHQNEKTKLLPIIAISGSSDAKESCLQVGCAAFVQKPFRLPALLIQIVKCLGEHDPV